MFQHKMEMLLRTTYDASGNPYSRNIQTIAILTPTGATGMLFINPFVVDPNDENIMIITAGSVLWRNNQLNLYQIIQIIKRNVTRMV